MTITIRRAVAGDAQFLPAIERSAGEAFRTVPHLAWIADHDVMPVEEHLAYIATGTSWVAVDAANQITGFLSAEHTEDALHIWEVSVCSALHGQGIGRALMDCADSYAAEHGLAAVTLTTFRAVPWNEPLYQRLGFQTLNRRELGPRLTAILDNEAGHGLPGDQRCAMRKRLLSR